MSRVPKNPNKRTCVARNIGRNGDTMKKRISTTINIGALSGVSVSDFYSVCQRFNVEVISCNKIGGLFVKTYHVTIEGEHYDLQRVATVFSG